MAVQATVEDIAAYRASVNAAQLEVLRWVSAGCEDGHYEGYSHRVSAAALRSRGLITITGRGPTWRAEITPRGKAVLEASVPAAQATQRRTTEAAISANGVESRPAVDKPLSKTEQLITDIVAAGDSLTVPYWRENGQPDYRQRALAAIRFGKVPSGRRLVMNRMRNGGLELRLEDDPAGMDLSARQVPVPARLGKAHPVAARYRDRTDDHLVSRAALSRSVRILHGLVVESERRGYQVSSPDARGRDDDRRRAKDLVVHVVIGINGHPYNLSISEGKVGLRGVWEEAKRREEEWRRRWPGHNSGARPKPYDAEASGQLSISLVAAGYTREGRPSSWNDRKSWTLEEKLPELLYELELRAVEDEERAIEARRQQEERRIRWEQMMEDARAQFADAHRAKVLRSQATARREARLLADYLSDLKEAHSTNPDAGEWIEWIGRFIERLDPLTTVPSMPAAPEPSHEDLKEFLPRGVSPYGPERYQARDVDRAVTSRS